MKFGGIGISELAILLIIIATIVIWRLGSRPSESTTTTPVLDSWKTSIGATIGGIFICLLIFGTGGSAGLIDGLFIALDTGATGGTSGSIFPTLSGADYRALAITFCMTIAGLCYALVIYPSLFTAAPKIKNSNAISFLNGFFGYIIFGCIWNSNLTKQHKGISNKVFALISVVAFIGNVVVIASSL